MTHFLDSPNTPKYITCIPKHRPESENNEDKRRIEIPTQEKRKVEPKAL